MRAAAAIGAAWLLGSCVSMSEYSVRPAEYSGVRLYQVFCSSCHGLSGHGDGPLEPALARGAPDLTRLAERNGGSFPADRVFRIIEGSEMPTAHGAREMPVWGFEFRPERGSDRSSRAEAERVISRLVKYLETIQPGDD